MQLYWIIDQHLFLSVPFYGGHYNFAVSTGNVTEEIIAQYIQNQDEIERRKVSENFQVGLLAYLRNYRLQAAWESI